MSNTICKRASSFGGHIVPLLLCLMWQPVSGGQGGSGSTQKDMNVVEHIRAVNSNVEIQLRSSREFPVTDDVVILRIGKHDFSKSRSPKDGSLKVLIFVLTAEEFAALSDGEEMTVRYRTHVDTRDAPEHPRRPWNFGKLNKSLLGR